MAIKKLLSAGDDAFGNLYKIKIMDAGKLPLSDDGQNLIGSDDFAMRVEKVNIPAVPINAVKLKNQDAEVDIPFGQADNPQEFTFELRVDKYWTVYKALQEWRNLIYDEKKMMYSKDFYEKYIKGIFMTVKVVNYEGKRENILPYWHFENVYPKQIGEVSLDYSSGEPVKIPINMGFTNIVRR